LRISVSNSGDGRRAYFCQPGNVTQPGFTFGHLSTDYYTAIPAAQGNF
jgi:hypothetical protein